VAESSRGRWDLPLPVAVEAQLRVPAEGAVIGGYDGRAGGVASRRAPSGAS
jgi:hypothetical protein